MLESNFADRSKVAFAIDHYILHRVSYVHRATSICADKDQENFALLQCQANALYGLIILLLCNLNNIQFLI